MVLTVGGHKDVGHALGIPVVATLVFILLFREAGDDIPGVDESRQISKNAKENVDEGVGRAKAALHPDWQRRKKDGQKAEKDVGGTHIQVLKSQISMRVELW